MRLTDLPPLVYCGPLSAALFFALSGEPLHTAAQTRPQASTDVRATDASVNAGNLANATPDNSRDCAPPPRCDGAPPVPARRTTWRHLRTRSVVLQGTARHRGRDLFVREGAAQWAIAKFAYGIADADLKDEEVEVWLQRNCERWEQLGVARTSEDGQHATTEGVEDSGGRIYLEIPRERALAVGWHRVHFIVRGDGSRAEQRIRVLPSSPHVVVTDVDGTLTESEAAEFPAMLRGRFPVTHVGAPEVFQALSQRGYDIMYLTARPEWLLGRTREWLALRGFPPGIVHTTLTGSGLIGDGAESFKTEELRSLQRTLGTAPTAGFGNMPSDIRAYQAVSIDPAHAFFFRHEVPAGRGRRHDDYRTLIPVVQSFARNVCQ